MSRTLFCFFYLYYVMFIHYYFSLIICLFIKNLFLAIILNVLPSTACSWSCHDVAQIMVARRKRRMNFHNFWAYVGHTYEWENINHGINNPKYGRIVQFKDSKIKSQFCTFDIEINFAFHFVRIGKFFTRFFHFASRFPHATVHSFY